MTSRGVALMNIQTVLLACVSYVLSVQHERGTTDSSAGEHLRNAFDYT